VKNCIFKQRLWVLGSGRSTIRLLPALITTEEQGRMRSIGWSERCAKRRAPCAVSSPWPRLPSEVVVRRKKILNNSCILTECAYPHCARKTFSILR
jgi:hypothetical protein